MVKMSEWASTKSGTLSAIYHASDCNGIYGLQLLFTKPNGRPDFSSEIRAETEMKLSEELAFGDNETIGSVRVEFGMEIGGSSFLSNIEFSDKEGATVAKLVPVSTPDDDEDFQLLEGESIVGIRAGTAGGKLVSIQFRLGKKA